MRERVARRIAGARCGGASTGRRALGPKLEVMHVDAAERAVWLFEQDDAPGFTDRLHPSLAQESGRTPWSTVEAKTSRLPGARRLPR